MRSPKYRLGVLCGVGVLLVGLALGYNHFFLSRPVGVGPAGPVVPHEPFTSVWSEKEIMLIGIGDSVTAGLGARTPDHSYFNRLINNPADEFADMRGKCLSKVLPNLQHRNTAISGSTSDTHLEVITQSLQVHESSVFGLVVITSGGNDLIHSYGRAPARECAMWGATLAEAEPWIAAFRTRLDQMLDQIEVSFPGGCEIFIADIYDPTDGAGDALSIYLPPWPDGLAIHSRYNTAIADVAEARSNVHRVPVHQAFLGHGSHCRQFWRSTYDSDDPTYWFYSNVEDPNDRGYDAIRRLFLNAIVEHSQLVPK